MRHLRGTRDGGTSLDFLAPSCAPVGETRQIIVQEYDRIVSFNNIVLYTVGALESAANSALRTRKL